MQGVLEDPELEAPEPLEPVLLVPLEAVPELVERTWEVVAAAAGTLWPDLLSW